MPSALKICGSALIPHSFSVNASSAFAALFIQQWEAALPFRPCTTSMPGRILPPLTSSWLQWSGDLGHHCSYLLCFGACPKPGRLRAGCMAGRPAEQDSARAIRPVFSTINRPVGVQPRNQGCSTKRGCFVTLPREARSLPGLAVPHWDLGCFAPSLPEQPVAQGGQSPNSGCMNHRSQHFISEMKLWHVLSEAPLLQARRSPIRSDPVVQAPSQLALCFND